MTTVWSLLAVWYTAKVLAVAKVFEPLRSAAHWLSGWTGYLFSCQMCLATWLGLVLSFAQDGSVLTKVIRGLAYAGVANILQQCDELLENVFQWLRSGVPASGQETGL